MIAAITFGPAVAVAADGENLWSESPDAIGTDGVHVADNGSNPVQLPVIIPDSQGGAYVAANIALNSTFVARINGAGEVLWTNNVASCSVNNFCGIGAPALISTGSGCYVIAAIDEITTANPDRLFAQQFDLNGNAVWSQAVALNSSLNTFTERPSVALYSIPAFPPVPPVLWVGMGLGRIANVTNTGVVSPINGFAVDAMPGAGEVQIVQDGQFFGGIYAVWKRGDGTLAAQRYAGSPVTAQWPSPVSIAPAPVTSQVEISNDAQGGLLVAWEAVSAGGGTAVRVQRVTADGVRQFGGTSGLAVFDSNIYGGTFPSEPLASLAITHDNAGGAIVAWSDLRNDDTVSDGRDDDVFAQRVLSNGQIAWQPGGVPIAPFQNSEGAPGAQNQISIAPDGAGGAVAVFTDFVYPFRSISGTRINGNGEAVWSRIIAPLFPNGPGNQDHREPSVAFNGGVGANPDTALVAWKSTASGILAQNLDLTPDPPHPADLNGDGVVDGADLATLLSQFGGPGSADLNDDGIVDGADLAQLLSAWGA